MTLYKLTHPQFFKSPGGEKVATTQTGLPAGPGPALSIDRGRGRQASFQSFRIRSGWNVMGNPCRDWKLNPKKGLGLISLIGLKGFRPKAFTTRLPVSGSIGDAEIVWPGRTLRKGLIGRYRFWVEQIRPNDRQGSLDIGGLVTSSI